MYEFEIISHSYANWVFIITFVLEILFYIKTLRFNYMILEFTVENYRSFYGKKTWY